MQPIFFWFFLDQVRRQFRMSRFKGFALAALLLTTVLYSPLLAQRPTGNPRNADAGKGGQRGAAPAAPVDYRPKAQSAEEFQAFQAINTEPNPANKVT